MSGTVRIGLRRPPPTGSALEHNDCSICAAAASVIFPQIFFPKGDPTVAIVASLATYYIARPIGAFFLAHWRDTHGRKEE